MSSYEKNEILSRVSGAIGFFLTGVGGILSVLDGQAWELVICGVGIALAGFAIFADN